MGDKCLWRADGQAVHPASLVSPGLQPPPASPPLVSRGGQEAIKRNLDMKKNLILSGQHFLVPSVKLPVPPERGSPLPPFPRHSCN